MSKTAREQITEAALAQNWTTDGGYSTEAECSAGWSGHAPDGRGLHVEFSSRGGITYASYGMGRQAGISRWTRIRGRDQLGQVLAYIKPPVDVVASLRKPYSEANGNCAEVSKRKITLTDRQLDLLRTYEDGPFIWDAASLRPIVFELRGLGLIRPVPPEMRADELTIQGRLVLAGMEGE